jgi:hypothetical protein
MDLDDLLARYFGFAEIDTVPPAAQAAGIEKMRVDFGLERDRAKRFALWCLLYLLGAAPELDVAFKDAEDRDAARNFMHLAAEAG